MVEMAPSTVPTSEPSTAIAGLTWRWDRVVDDYTPAAGWALKYVFLGAESELQLTGVAASGNLSWELTASATLTSALGPGTFTWLAYVELSTEKYAIGRGTTLVLQNPLTAQPGDFHPYAEKALVHVEAALLARASADMSAYTIKQRSVQREELKALQDMRGRLLAEIDAKKQSGTFGRRVEWRPKSYR